MSRLKKMFKLTYQIHCRYDGSPTLTEKICVHFDCTALMVGRKHFAMVQHRHGLSVWLSKKWDGDGHPKKQIQYATLKSEYNGVMNWTQDPQNLKVDLLEGPNQLPFESPLVDWTNKIFQNMFGIVLQVFSSIHLNWFHH